MAGKNWQASGRNSIPAWAFVCLVATAAPCGLALAASPATGFAPASYIGSLDPNEVWELLLAGVAVLSLLVAVGLWTLSALRGAKRAKLRRSAFISSALNNLNQGVMMTNAQNRVVFCNDRFLEMYGFTRADISSDMTGRDLVELRRSRGLLDLTAEEFGKLARRPEGVVTELPGGRAILSKMFRLPNGGTIGTHEDCTEQRRLSRKLASTTQFLESVLDNVPVCVAAKNIDDGRYIFVNRAFERFSRFSRDHIVGKRADEIFRPETAKSIEKADQAALNSPEGYHRSEYNVERGDDKRVLASNRVIARNDRGEPEFLIALFDDVTDRRSLSRELENTKKFLELVVDNIPVSLIVERVSDGRYLLANRSAETILNRRREDATGLTASDIFNPREARLIIARDEAAIKKRGLLTEEHPISTKDGLRLFLTRRMTVLDEAGDP
ncbi:MAG: PAS domain-containing protein, partial [bacterium]|nr:PAS domain-containing protein [bacterium]